MRSACTVVGAVLVGASVATASIAAEQGGRPAVAARPPDFKVVFWYRRDRPIETFRYQEYDLRKGEFTDAVRAWMEMMREKHPDYEVAVRVVDLETEKGPTEARKVGAVIHRELLAAAAEAGVFIGPLNVTTGNAPTFSPPEALKRPAPMRISPPYSPLGPMFNQNPAPAGFPVPMPYPRPHP